MLDLHLTAPVGRGGHRTRIGAEADQGCVLAEAFAAKLPKVELVTRNTHVGEARVADLGVCVPHDGFRIRPAASSRCTSVSNMWMSRTFQDAAPPQYMTR